MENLTKFFSNYWAFVVYTLVKILIIIKLTPMKYLKIGYKLLKFVALLVTKGVIRLFIDSWKEAFKENE